MAKIVIAKETAYAQLDRLKTLHTSIMREIKQEIKETKALVKKEEGFYVKDVSGVVKDLLGLYEKEVLSKLTESFSVTEKAVASMEKLINDEDKLNKM